MVCKNAPEGKGRTMGLVIGTGNDYRKPSASYADEGLNNPDLQRSALTATMPPPGPTAGEAAAHVQAAPTGTAKGRCGCL
jgi:hypothetical protein